MQRIVRYAGVVVSALSDNGVFTPPSYFQYSHDRDEALNEEPSESQSTSSANDSVQAVKDGMDTNNVPVVIAQSSVGVDESAEGGGAARATNVNLLGKKYNNRNFKLQFKGVKCSMFTAGHVFMALKGVKKYDQLDKALRNNLDRFGNTCQKSFGMLPSLLTNFMALNKVDMGFNATKEKVIAALDKGNPIVALYAAQNIYNPDAEHFYHYAMVQKQQRKSSDKEKTFIVYNHMSSIQAKPWFLLQHTIFNRDALHKILFHDKEDVAVDWDNAFHGNLRLPMFAIPVDST